MEQPPPSSEAVLLCAGVFAAEPSADDAVGGTEEPLEVLPEPLEALPEPLDPLPKPVEVLPGALASFAKLLVETRCAHGGRQIIAGSALHPLLPFASAKQVPFGLSPQVKPDGQSESALHATVFRLHAFVPFGWQEQSGGGVVPASMGAPASAGSSGFDAGVGSPAPPSAAGAGAGVPAEPAPDDDELADPAQPHSCSSSHVNPSPQSASTLHGKRYFGTQPDIVLVVHVVSVACGQSCPLAQAGAVGQTSSVCV